MLMLGECLRSRSSQRRLGTLFLPAFEQSLGDALVAGLERVLDRLEMQR
jgi:hypothetical protein